MFLAKLKWTKLQNPKVDKIAKTMLGATPQKLCIIVRLNVIKDITLKHPIVAILSVRVLQQTDDVVMKV